MLHLFAEGIYAYMRSSVWYSRLTHVSCIIWYYQNWCALFPCKPSQSSDKSSCWQVLNVLLVSCKMEITRYSLLFLHRVSSHNYLNHRQNMDPMNPSSRSREPVGEVNIKLWASLASQRIHFTSQWQVLKDPRDHARGRKQRRLHLALIFEYTFHRLIAFLNCFA